VALAAGLDPVAATRFGCAAMGTSITRMHGDASLNRCIAA